MTERRHRHRSMDLMTDRVLFFTNNDRDIEPQTPEGRRNESKERHDPSSCTICVCVCVCVCVCPLISSFPIAYVAFVQFTSNT